jgi:hypothetical protein
MPNNFVRNSTLLTNSYQQQLVEQEGSSLKAKNDDLPLSKVPATLTAL